MFKPTLIVLTLILVEECFSAGDVTMKDVELLSNKYDTSCDHTAPIVTCSVKGGEKVNMTATLVVDGGDAVLGLVLFNLGVKFPDKVGDINSIPFCQETGGNFKSAEKPCSILIVPTGSYKLEPYEFQIPHSGSKTTEQVSFWGYYKWSDGSESSKRLSVVDLIFKK